MYLFCSKSFRCSHNSRLSSNGLARLPFSYRILQPFIQFLHRRASVLTTVPASLKTYLPPIHAGVREYFF